MPIQGYAAYAAKENLRPFSYEPGRLGPLEIAVRIRYCGICHSDIHLIDDDWGWSRYPFIPGHEIIGEVTEVGDLVDHLAVGDRVGVGWQAGSCMTCEWCTRGDTQLCARQTATCVARNGGFADAVHVDSRFAFRIPEELDSAHAAPLLCAGITVYSPLREFRVAPPSKVGVAGIGGLGHLAIQFARAFGCEVTVISSNPDKEEESRRLGGHRFVHSGDRAGMARAAGSLDFLLVTAFGSVDWLQYLNLLRPRGTLCIVGASPSPLDIQPALLVIQEKRICGSVVGGPPAIREMLDFAARHRIEAAIELVPIAQVNAAVDKVRAGKARYRVVLEV